MNGPLRTQADLDGRFSRPDRGDALVSGVRMSDPSPQVGLPAVLHTPLMAPVFSTITEFGCGEKATMVVSLAQPSQYDIEGFQFSHVDVAARVDSKTDVAFLNWRFKPRRGGMFHVRTALHLLLMDMKGEHPEDLLGIGEDRSVILVLQDERPYYIMMRFLGMPRAVSDYLAPSLKRQLTQRHLSRREIVRRQDASTMRYLDAYPDVAAEFASAPAWGNAT